MTYPALTVNYLTQRFRSHSEDNKDVPSGLHANTRPPMDSLVIPTLTCPPMDSLVIPTLTCPPMDSLVIPTLTCLPTGQAIPSDPYPSLLW